MNECLNDIFEFYGLLMQFIFEDMVLFTGVSFGWILITLIVFGILVRSILALPRGLISNVSRESGGSNE